MTLGLVFAVRAPVLVRFGAAGDLLYFLGPSGAVWRFRECFGEISKIFGGFREPG